MTPNHCYGVRRFSWFCYLFFTIEVKGINSIGQFLTRAEQSSSNNTWNPAVERFSKKTEFIFVKAEDRSTMCTGENLRGGLNMVNTELGKLKQ